MSDKENTAACGIYCPDCIWLRNKLSPLAAELLTELERVGFDKYAGIKSPFGSPLRGFEQCRGVLGFVAGMQCAQPCRTGGGCSGKPCDIMKCCQEKGFEGCWLCQDYQDCEKFTVLLPRCGKMPRHNLDRIAKLGVEKWSDARMPFYIWQQKQ